MRIIKLMPDYQCFPLWEASPGKIGNIDPDTLPVSTALKAQIQEWARHFDETLNMDDPINSGFSTPEAEKKFKAKGVELGALLQKELGEQYRVTVED